MKIKNKIITVSILAVVLVVCMIFHLCTAVNIDVDKVTLTKYSSIEMTDKRVAKLNSNKEEKFGASSYFTNFWEIPKNKDGDYGNIFEINIHFQLSRYVPVDDYIVGFDVDYSGVDETEKIFFADALGWTDDQYLFQCNGGDDPAQTFVCFTGCTYDKDEKEIFRIVNKVKITIMTQDKLGRIKRRKIDISDIRYNVSEADEEDTESMMELFQ